VIGIEYNLHKKKVKRMQMLNGMWQLSSFPISWLIIWFFYIFSYSLILFTKWWLSYHFDILCLPIYICPLQMLFEVHIYFYLISSQFFWISCIIYFFHLYSPFQLIQPLYPNLAIFVSAHIWCHLLIHFSNSYLV